METSKIYTLEAVRVQTLRERVLEVYAREDLTTTQKQVLVTSMRSTAVYEDIPTRFPIILQYDANTEIQILASRLYTSPESVYLTMAVFRDGVELFPLSVDSTNRDYYFINPPTLVRDPDGPIAIDFDGTIERFREDPWGALQESIMNTISARLRTISR